MLVDIRWSSKPNKANSTRRLCFVPLRLRSYHTGEQSERLQVLQDVAVLGGDEDHVELLQRLVHVADAVGLYEGVLLARVHQFGEGSEETLDTRPGHFHKLPGYDGLPGLGAHRRCQQHLRSEGGLAVTVHPHIPPGLFVCVNRTLNEYRPYCDTVYLKQTSTKTTLSRDRPCKQLAWK